MEVQALYLWNVLGAEVMQGTLARASVFALKIQHLLPFKWYRGSKEARPSDAQRCPHSWRPDITSSRGKTSARKDILDSTILLKWKTGFRLLCFLLFLQPKMVKTFFSPKFCPWTPDTRMLIEESGVLHSSPWVVGLGPLGSIISATQKPTKKIVNLSIHDMSLRN